MTNNRQSRTRLRAVHGHPDRPPQQVQPTTAAELPVNPRQLPPGGHIGNYRTCAAPGRGSPPVDRTGRRHSTTKPVVGSGTARRRTLAGSHHRTTRAHDTT